MNSARPLRTLAILLALTALGFAHWLFGNLYEAVVVAPNWSFTFAAERALGRVATEASSPIRYFVPWAQLSTLLAVASYAYGRRPSLALDPPTLRWLAVAALGAIAAQALTGYVVTQINLKLFFGNSFSPAEAEALAARWRTLNLVRVAAEAVTLASTLLALESVHRKLVLSDTR